MTQIRQSKESRVLLAQLQGEDGPRASNGRKNRLSADEATLKLQAADTVTDEML